MTVQEAILNLPKGMHESEIKQYVKNLKEIKEIEQTKLNTHLLESLKNSNFWIIRPYIETKI
jgi:hypothetical protein